MHIHITDFGCSLGKKSERLVVKEKGKVKEEYPFFNVETVTVDSRGVSLSSDVIRECMEHGIQINFLSGSGKPYAKLSSPNLTGTVITRREQILAYIDKRGVILGKTLVEGKLKNQANLLKYFSKYRKSTGKEIYQEIVSGIEKICNIQTELKTVGGNCIDEVRGALLSIEGRGANTYWNILRLILEGRIDFPGREHRGTIDPFNSLLNYGYGILYQQVWGAVLLAGLEPFAGFLHVDRPGKPSLILDLVEEFRQPVVDRTVVAMVNKGTEVKMDDNGLEQKTRKELATKIIERLETPVLFEGKKTKLKHIIQKQSRRLAMFLRGQAKYRCFVSSW
ncbi:CRISPR-associated endonuclease Cas1 [Phosphitispora sp. TUW77]|uniref:CRISPR-associated endonuclease Cas1 n=1 Tax=Phosphitispora sp. TUW77 TaxID=3152361 RepID=UPI003AB48E9C